MMAIKPPYLVAATIRDKVSREEFYLAMKCDDMARSLRMHELIFNMPAGEREIILKRHADAAYEYYSHFSKEDMTKLVLMEALMSASEEEE